MYIRKRTFIKAFPYKLLLFDIMVLFYIL